MCKCFYYHVLYLPRGTCGIIHTQKAIGTGGERRVHSFNISSSRHIFAAHSASLRSLNVLLSLVMAVLSGLLATLYVVAGDCNDDCDRWRWCERFSCVYYLLDLRGINEWWNVGVWPLEYLKSWKWIGTAREVYWNFDLLIWSSRMSFSWSKSWNITHKLKFCIFFLNLLFSVCFVYLS